MYDPSEALLQLGLYDYVWGNPSLLQTYNANVQAQKARDEQAKYNMLWKSIEERNAKSKQDAEEALARKEKEAKLADLYKQYNNATGAQERALIRRQINTLEGSNKVKNEMLDAYDADKKAAALAEEQEAERFSKALKEMGKIKQGMAKAKTPKDKEALGLLIYNEDTFPNMNRAERDKMYAEVMGLKTLGEKIQESSEGAIASHTGKKTGEKLDEKDKAAKYQEMKEQGKILTPSQEALRKKYYGE